MVAKKKIKVVAPVNTETTEELVVEIPPAPVQEIDVDTYSDNLSAAQINQLNAPRKVVGKPDISGLPSAIGPDGFPVFVAGDRIVIERYASFLQGNPYLDTRTYRVEAVDLISGKVNLWDESLCQYAIDNWRHGIKIGQVYKLSLGRLVSSKGKRGRPRKNPVVSPVVATTPGEKKKRGRPKGVKNRSKDVIRAEKKEREIAKAAKKTKRTTKKAKR